MDTATEEQARREEKCGGRRYSALQIFFGKRLTMTEVGHRSEEDTKVSRW